MQTPPDSPSRRLRILWICGSDVVGGAEYATLLVASALVQRGHLVEVLCRPAGPVEIAARAAGLEVRAATLGGALNLLAWLAVQRALTQAAPDVALVTTADEWVWACLARRPAATRLVLARHMVVPLPARVRRLAGRRADAIVAVSGAVRDSLLCGPEIGSDTVHVIPIASRFPAADSVPDLAARQRARRELGLPADGFWIGFFGGTGPNKGLDDALRAIAAANRELAAPVHLLACGTLARRDDEAHVGARARALGIGAQVHWRGTLAQMDLALTSADVALVATRRQLGEAMPLTVAEAMALGTPVVAYAVGGIPELVGEGEESGGRLVPPDDVDALSRAVVTALRDTSRTRSLGEHALARIRTRFEPARVAAAHEELFLRLPRRA